MIRGGRVGRPGLIGTMARTAVITGTATAVQGGMRNRAARRSAEQDQYAYQQEQQMADRISSQVQAQQQVQQQAAPAAAAPDRVQQLRDLAQLKADGVLTDEEFAAEKARVLAT
ncbi:SHOCT domain-containing protein [Actinocorallia longicatena]|uniref:SHOCT domain-containing protein n=1 Tax=Actinocorallia longicatena TaxID=111803 RepID=A0ABP6Q275_9ACTN